MLHTIISCYCQSILKVKDINKVALYMGGGYGKDSYYGKFEEEKYLYCRMVFYMQKQWGNLWITFFSFVLMYKVYGPWCFVCSASRGGA